MRSAKLPGRHNAFMLIVAAALVVGACGDGPTDPDPGGEATRLVIGAIGQPTAGVPFSVTVRHTDTGGNPVEAGTPSTITLGVAEGTGTLRGTTMATLDVGATEVTIAGVIYDHAEDGVRLEVTGTGGAAGLTAVSDAFAPDFDFGGELIAFRRTLGEREDIYLMTPDGLAFVNVTDDPAVDSDPAWSPDGSRIAFVSTRAGNADLWVMSVDGTGLIQVTDDQGSIRFPNWSPDGSMIAYSANVNDQRDLYVIEAPSPGSASAGGWAASGQQPGQITDDPGTDNEPVWSPDGSGIFFYSNRDGQGAVWSIEFDGTAGSNPIRLTADFVFACAPGLGWSLVDTRLRLSFVGQTGNQLDVWQMDLDGSNPVNVTNHPESDEFYSTWTSEAPGANTTTGGLTLAPAVAGAQQARLIFDSDRDGRWQLYSSLEDGSDVVRLTDYPSDDRMPRWRP